jgi:hypothetical protein
VHRGDQAPGRAGECDIHVLDHEPAGRHRRLDVSAGVCRVAERRGEQRTPAVHYHLRQPGAGADQPAGLACHLAQLVGDAAPDDIAVHTARDEVYALRAAQERSTMSTGIFTWAEAESRGVIAGTDTMTELTSAAPPQ